MRRALIVSTVLLVAVTGCSSSGSPKSAQTPSFAYGANPVAIAKTLNICAVPTSISATVAECTFSDGTVGIASIASASAQSYAASVADSGSIACDMIGQGFTVQAPDSVLAAHVDVTVIEAQYDTTMHGQC